MKHRYVSRDTRQTMQKKSREAYNREQRASHATPVYNNAGQTNSFTFIYRVESRSNRPHSIASLSWMESVPYWLKQHERYELLEHVYTNLRIFFFFFYLFSFY